LLNGYFSAPKIAGNQLPKPYCMSEIIKTSLILADDHPLYMKGLTAVLQRDFLILGAAGNGKELLDLLQTMQPNAILIDLQMPLMDGVCASKLICRHYPYIKIIILSGYYDSEIAGELKRTGVMGYLTKDINKDRLVFQIKQVLNGHLAFCDPQNNLQANPNAYIPCVWAESKKLSCRELQVVSLIKTGLTSNEIASKLFISVNTVEAHRKNIFKKLEVRNIQGLLEIAHKFSV
jgi:DNA-binding NarL/FixJ family response regulator